MSGFLKAQWFKLAVIFLCLILAAVVIYKRLEPPKLEVLGQAADFELTDLQQQKTTLENSNGKVRLFYFFFANCPDVCGPTTYMLSKVQAGLKKQGIFGKEAAMLSITFDPARDSTESLTEFSGRFKADPSGWYFLRGEEQYTKEVAEQYGVAVLKDAEGNFMHSNAIILVDKDGNKRKFYNANKEDLTPEQIIEDMVRLSKE